MVTGAERSAEAALRLRGRGAMETTPRSDAREYKSVDQTMPEPFGHLEVSVCPVSVFGRPGVVGHSVGVMDMSQGRGSRTSLERAEAEAKAVLKAIRAYRRRNADDLAREVGEDV